MRNGCLISLLFLGLASTAQAVGPNNALNDTGIVLFGDNASNALTTEPATHPRQDASQGRDAAHRAGTLVKVGGGNAGFDFTKIANSGAVLPADATLGTGPADWGCTYDNVTGLMWEVKVADSGQLRHVGFQYSWYNSNFDANGGSAGTASNPSDPRYCKTAGRCDTEKFVHDVNAAGLCGHGDWRMPTSLEFLSIITQIGSSYFPNRSGDIVGWASPDPTNSNNAMCISDFSEHSFSKSFHVGVYVVRAGK